MLAKLATEFCLDLLEVNGLEARARATLDPRLVANNLAAKRLRETANRLTKVALEELHNGGREVQLVGAVQHILLGEAVLNHPLRKVSDDLGGRRDLDNISALWDEGCQ